MQRKKQSAWRKELRKTKKDKNINDTAQVNSLSPYKARSTLIKAVKRADTSLPHSPHKKRAVVKQLECKVKLDFSRKNLNNTAIENGIKEIGR